jgi:methylmalonyl-CoA mutase C-terminal domain/subunit
MKTKPDHPNTSRSRPIRILIGKPGLDGHDRGAKVIARALRDAGCEVIYTGLRQSPESIVQSAVQEDVDVLGMSILSGAHDVLVPEVLELLGEYGRDDVLVLVGGVIPEADAEQLRAQGVDAVFGPDSETHEIVEYVFDRLAE